MGTWADGIFDNDSAGELADRVAGGGGIAAIEKALDKVLPPLRSEADEALAAADIVARLLGSFGQQDAYTEEIDNWVKNSQATVAPILVEKALWAIERVLADHAKEMAMVAEDPEAGEDPADYEEWRNEIQALVERLRPFARPGVPIAPRYLGYGSTGPKSREGQILVNRPSPFMSPVAILARERGGEPAGANKNHSERNDPKSIDPRLPPALLAGAGVGTAVMAAGMWPILPGPGTLSHLAEIVANSFVGFCATTLALWLLYRWSERHPGRFWYLAITGAFVAGTISFGHAVIRAVSSGGRLSDWISWIVDSDTPMVVHGVMTLHGWFVLLVTGVVYLLALSAALLTLRFVFHHGWRKK